MPMGWKALGEIGGSKMSRNRFFQKIFWEYGKYTFSNLSEAKSENCDEHIPFLFILKSETLAQFFFQIFSRIFVNAVQRQLIRSYN